MWTIRLVDRKNGIKMWAEKGFIYSIALINDINQARLFDTRQQARDSLRDDKSKFGKYWEKLGEQGIYATVVKVKVEITEAP